MAWNKAARCQAILEAALFEPGPWLSWIVTLSDEWFAAYQRYIQKKYGKSQLHAWYDLVSLWFYGYMMFL